MTYVNLITNFCCLFLWFNWISIRYSTLNRPTGVTLAGTLRRAESDSRRQWASLLLLVGIVFLRAFFYYIVQSHMRLDLGIISVPFHAIPGFRSLFRLILFSGISFVVSLAAVYSWLTLLSSANFQMPNDDAMQKIVRLHLNRLERLPRPIKLLLPFVAGLVFWMMLQPCLSHLGIVPKISTWQKWIEQSALLGVAAYLPWKYLIVAVLLLHLLNSYLYLGRHPFWAFINATARNLLLPLSWLPLRAGKVDLLPLVGIAGIFLASEAFTRLPISHPSWLPF